MKQAETLCLVYLQVLDVYLFGLFGNENPGWVRGDSLIYLHTKSQTMKIITVSKVSSGTPYICRTVGYSEFFEVSTNRSSKQLNGC